MALNREIIRLFDEYTHAPLDRRVFLKRLAALAGGAAAAQALLPMLENNYAQAAFIPEDDQRLAIETITYAGATGEMTGYWAQPADATDPLPAIIVIHENRGLNPHIQDVVRRAALAGYVALGPDFLSPAGGTPTDEDAARDLIGGLDPQQTLDNALATLAFLLDHEAVTDKVGCVGFCWGGGLTNRLATNTPLLAAAVPFYGSAPPAEEVPNITAPLLLHYAELDDRINAGIPGYEAALQSADKTYTLHMYEGVDHAFHNDTNASRYNEAAATLAWERTLAFFQEHLV
ncbi:MAG: dienelactone hydrolase family protein [Synechococcaceae cyanobacterium RM1_1_27]|nr:dienelactone hydrolase family protein [Synechococcaceae cyanobacterium SM2_3_2]NJO85319.1 dienelactone hydrolase family protein [Synechococcaceae cyanobacterium RM1_1_27]